jgi:hypothetical protein
MIGLPIASFSLAQSFGLHFDASDIGVKSSEPVLAAVPDQRAFLICDNRRCQIARTAGRCRSLQ